MFDESCVYHIYNRANGSENLFREEKNYDFFLTRYKKYIQPFKEIHKMYVTDDLIRSIDIGALD